MSKWDNAVQKNLLKPFDIQIKWKPQVTTRGKNKEPILRNGQRVAGCTAHIDARDVMNRLDEVVGAENWSDAYAIIGSRNVECRLTVLEVTKCDIGEINEGGFADPFKSAYSDALKRAAVKFGIGRHLYGMEMEWLLFDGYKIIEQPGPTTVSPPNGKAADKRGDTSPTGETPFTVEDRREWLKSKFKNDSIELGIVGDAAAMTEHYNDWVHAKNALTGHDGPEYPEGFDFPDGFKIIRAQKVTNDGALKIYDWLMARKEAEDG